MSRRRVEWDFAHDLGSERIELHAHLTEPKALLGFDHDGVYGIGEVTPGEARDMARALTAWADSVDD